MTIEELLELFSKKYPYGDSYPCLTLFDDGSGYITADMDGRYDVRMFSFLSIEKLVSHLRKESTVTS